MFKKLNKLINRKILKKKCSTLRYYILISHWCVGLGHYTPNSSKSNSEKSSWPEIGPNGLYLPNCGSISSSNVLLFSFAT